MSMAVNQDRAGNVRVDPVTFEVVRHKLEALVEEQALTLKSVSGSPIVSEATDYNCGLYLADGSIVATGKQVLFHSGTCCSVIRNVIADCDRNPGIYDGDMFIVNNPYKGAIHPPDVSIVAPIFYQGERIAWAGAVAHQLDVGGMDFGSWCPKATEIQQECIIIPPVKMVEGGKIREDIWAMIMSNSRLPFIIGLDFKAMIAANNVAKRRFAVLIERYGWDTVKAIMAGVLDLSEQRMRDRLMELPNGKYRAINYLDHDGLANRLYRFYLTVIKKDDKLIFDFTGSAKQAPGFINCTLSGLTGSILSGLLPVLAFDIPWNEGLLRPLEIVSQPGTVNNALWPAPVGSGTCAAAWVTESVATEAVAKIVNCTEKYAREGSAVQDANFAVLNMAGLNQYGEPFGTMLLDPNAGGGGAYSFRDGIDCEGPHTIPAGNIANVETNENFAPMLYISRRYVADSGGPGEFRGGRTGGLAFILHDTEHLDGLLVSHSIESPCGRGIFGGYPASCGINLLLKKSDLDQLLDGGELPAQIGDASGELTDLGAKPGRISIDKGDILEYTWCGGGGYGDPLDRSPDAVMDDVRRGAVSVEWARRSYAVVVNSSLQLDREASHKLREEVRAERLARPQRRPSKVSVPSGTPEIVLMPMGTHTRLVEIAGKKVVRCKCGYIFCQANENWKEYAGFAIVSPTNAGPLVKLHEDLEMREYTCPKCARLHSVEVMTRDEPPLWDIEPEL